MKTIIYFGADWCGSCQEIESTVADYIIDTGYRFLKYKVDEAPKLTQKYQINVIPTLIILNDEKLQDKIIGKKPILEYLVKD